MRDKKGQLWISAALYMALGIILVSLILSVGLPFVNKIKERNVVLQTKDVMFSLDKIISEVNLEGKGSRRPILIDIGEGEFTIDNADNIIQWSFISEDRLGIESDVDIYEGSLLIRSDKLGQGYNIKLVLDYENRVDLAAENSVRTISGTYNLVVEHGETDQIIIKESS